VTVAPARATSVPMIVELPGRTNPYRVAQVRARVDGIVLKRNFREGADVKAGQRLYQVDPAPFKAALASAQAALDKSVANLAAVTAQAERFGVLVAANAISKQEYDNAVASRGQALADVAAGKAAVQIAAINLAYTEVVAPISGRAGLSAVTEGAFVQGSNATLMTTIQQIDPIYVDLTQSSVQALQLRREMASRAGQTGSANQVTVTVFLEGGEEYPLKGTLQFTDITVDQGTGSVIVRAIVPNPRYVLLPGMFVRARLNRGVDDDALLVPQAGVTHNAQGQATAFVVGPDSKVALRTIHTTRLVGDSWIVDGGLEEGEQVVLPGVQTISSGMTVRIAESVPAVRKAQEMAQAESPRAPDRTSPTRSPGAAHSAPTAAAASAE
jgi:membrane fusion protein (multidrug efflux system)